MTPEKGTAIHGITDNADEAADAGAAVKPESPDTGAIKPDIEKAPGELLKDAGKPAVPEPGDEAGKISGGSGTGQSSIELIREEHNSIIYKNPAGTELRVPKQSVKNIDTSINSKLKSTDAGDIAEGEVGRYIRDNTSEKITHFAAKITNTDTKNRIGDIDVMTENYFIEVKKSKSVVSEGQLVKYTEIGDEGYFNVGNKDVILYIKEKINDPSYISNLESKYNGKIKVVNSLEELGEVLK